MVVVSYDVQVQKYFNLETYYSYTEADSSEVFLLYSNKFKKYPFSLENFTSLHSNCAFTPQAARVSKWPEVIHFQCEPAASSGESGAARFGR